MSTLSIPPAGQPPLWPNYYYLIDLKDFMEDGVTLDTAEAIIVGTPTLPAVMTAELVAGNPRQLKVIGHSVGASSVTITAPGVPQNGVLTVNVTVTAAPNLSKVEAGPITGPFPV